MKKIFTLFAILFFLTSCHSENQNPEKTISNQETTQTQTTQKPGKIFTKTDQFIVQIMGETEIQHQVLQIFREKMIHKMNENINENERENFYFFPRLRIRNGMTALYGEYYIFHKEFGLIQEERMIFYPKNLENYEWNVITSAEWKFDCKIIETLDPEILPDPQWKNYPNYKEFEIFFNCQ